MRDCCRCWSSWMILRTCYCRWIVSFSQSPGGGHTRELSRQWNAHNRSDSRARTQRRRGSSMWPSLPRRTMHTRFARDALGDPRFPSEDQARKRRRRTSTHVWRRSHRCTRENQLRAAVTRHAISKSDNAADSLDAWVSPISVESLSFSLSLFVVVVVVVDTRVNKATKQIV